MKHVERVGMTGSGLGQKIRKESGLVSLGPIYSDGLAGSEEEIEDAIEGGLSRYELGIQFGLPVDRKANEASDVVEI